MIFQCNKVLVDISSWPWTLAPLTNFIPELRISNFNSWPNVVEDKLCWLIEVRSAKIGQLGQL